MKDIINESEYVYSNVVSAPSKIGTGEEDATFAPGPQERVDTCAIRSQQHVLSMYGIDIPESDLVKDAILHGEYSLFDDFGTSGYDVGNLLERNGIAVQRYNDATMANLISELAQGHKIVVAIDAQEVLASDEMRRNVEKYKDIFAEEANHAVVVVSVDAHTLDVDIVDPFDGQLHRIPGETFLDAWQDSGCFMIATTKSPEEYLKSKNVEQNLIENSNVIETNMIDDFIPKVDDVDNTGSKLISYDSIDMEDFIAMPNNDDVNNAFNDATGVNGEAMPHLGGLGHAAGINGEAMPHLGSLGHVAGVNEEAMPHLGSLGHVAGVNEEAMPHLGSLGHVAGVNEEAMPHLGNLGHVAGVDDGDLVIPEKAEVYINDTNGDGAPDMVGLDIEGDGRIDFIGVDLDHDGNTDLVTADVNGDGIPDMYFVDTNADGELDSVGADYNGDGYVDEVIPLT